MSIKTKSYLQYTKSSISTLWFKNLKKIFWEQCHGINPEAFVKLMKLWFTQRDINGINAMASVSIKLKVKVRQFFVISLTN